MEPFLGQIQAFGFNFAPRGWMMCQGQILNIAQNSALFALLGTTYGGDGQTTFGLPDLRGRFSLGIGAGPGLPNYNIGQIGGSNSVNILVSNMPSHNHSLGAAEEGSTDNPAGAHIAGSGLNAFASSQNTAMASNSIGLTGGNIPLNITNPYLCINFCIAVVGIFPSRN